MGGLIYKLGSISSVHSMVLFVPIFQKKKEKVIITRMVSEVLNEGTEEE